MSELSFSYHSNVRENVTRTEDLFVFESLDEEIEVPAGRIRGKVWNDLNGDGRLRNEPGLANVQVYIDANNNGRLDSNESVALTDEGTGEYQFEGLDAGTYILREVVPRGFSQTFPIGSTLSTGDGFADVVLDYFDSGAGPQAGPYGANAAGNFPVPVSTDVVLGSDELGALSLPTGSSITVGFTDEVIVDRPGDDIFVLELLSAGERAEIFVSSNLEDFVRLGIGNGGRTSSFDLADIGFTAPVRAVKIVGLDNGGASPGFDVVNISGLPDSVASPDFYTLELTEGELADGINFGNRQRIGPTNRINGTENNDRIIGTDGKDLIKAFGGNDRVSGKDGNDLILGGKGNDTLFGDDDNDKLLGGDGNDRLFGGKGNDTLKGEENNDRILGGGGNDRLLGGKGNDTIAGGAGNDSLIGDDGEDVLKGDAGDDKLVGGKGNDELIAGAGNDRLVGGDGKDLLVGGNGNDRLIGGEGNDSLVAGNGSDRLIGGGGNDELLGDGGDDILLGGAKNDRLSGDAGKDNLNGGAGNDELLGGSANDFLVGGSGNDTLVGERGNDTLIGGAGRDTFVLLANSGTDLIRDFSEGTDLIGLAGGLRFGSLTLNTNKNRLQIQLGNKVLAELQGVSELEANDFVRV